MGQKVEHFVTLEEIVGTKTQKMSYAIFEWLLNEKIQEIFRMNFGRSMSYINIDNNNQKHENSVPQSLNDKLVTHPTA